MARVEVAVPGAAYPVLVGLGALQELPRLVRELGVSSVALVTDENVAAAWGEVVGAGFSGLGLSCSTLVVEPGEGSKSLESLQRVLGFLESAAIDRQGLVVALGGGTVGDLAGFAAAIWLRGVRHVQVPTSLLAMVDSSVGGKTGVNTARTKNSVGAFWQPSAVVADLATLDTLPAAELRSACGEVVKYAVAMDRELAADLERDAAGVLDRDPGTLQRVVARCVELKAAVVSADERDRGRRAVLNYGHTAGHALESASGYTAAHGRAVAFGMRVAARIAARTGHCGPDVEECQDRLLARFGLPGELPPVTAAGVLSALPRDKKATGGVLGWVLPREVGRADTGRRVPPEVAEMVIRELLP